MRKNHHTFDINEVQVRHDALQLMKNVVIRALSLPLCNLGYKIPYFWLFPENGK